MYGDQPEDLFYYLTIYNEPYVQPEEPADLDVGSLLRGMYLYQPASAGGEVPESAPRAQLLASGVGMQWALRAAELLREDWGVHADVWSVTSWNELRRDGLAADEAAFSGGEQRTAFVTEQLAGRPGPVVAVSDYMRAVQDQIQPWVPRGELTSLGTDGWGLSDTRGALRRHFKVDAESVAVATLAALARQGAVDAAAPGQAAEKYQLSDVSAADPGLSMGEA
jgi:pyruvate dehydrogenase E1 component